MRQPNLVLLIIPLTFSIAPRTAQALWRYLSTHDYTSYSATYLLATHTESLTMVNNYLAIARTDTIACGNRASHNDTPPVTN